MPINWPRLFSTLNVSGSYRHNNENPVVGPGTTMGYYAVLPTTLTKILKWIKCDRDIKNKLMRLEA